MSILVVGSVGLDSIETPFGSCRDVLGGSATYFSLAASLFSPVNLVAVVGSDFKKDYLKILKQKNINLDGLEIKNGKTFRWVARYGNDLNNVETILTELNVFADFKPKIPAEYKKSRYVFLANIDPRLQEYVLSQVENPKLVAVDTMSHWIKNERKSLLNFLKKRVDVFFLNDIEARLLSGENQLYKATKSILKLGPKRVIVKKGENGVLMATVDSIFCLPAFLLERVYDPTGAGDTFAGGVIGYLAKGKKLDEKNFRIAVIFGTILATFAIEDFSVNRLLTLNILEVKKRLKKFLDLITFENVRL